MAFRIADCVVRGEIDNHVEGVVRGRLWLAGVEEVLELELQGNACGDIAGHRLEFVNPNPIPDENLCSRLSKRQHGKVGEMTASRRVRISQTNSKDPKSGDWTWVNAIYIEWFSEANGRVLIEGVGFHLSLDAEPAWRKSSDGAQGQQTQRNTAIQDILDHIAEALKYDGAEDEDAPQSKIEAEADREDARMNILIDRMTTRIDREEGEVDFDEIYEEEKERLRMERGEPLPPPLTSEEEKERAAWLDELMEIEAEIEEDEEAEAWKGEDDDEDDQHPLVKCCMDFSLELHRTLKAAGLLPGGAHPEHPLRELLDGVTIAGPKLAGALHREDWPPDLLFAGNVLVRLKNARRHLANALLGIAAACEENLAPHSFLKQASQKVSSLHTEVRNLIAEVRDHIKHQ